MKRYLSYPEFTDLIDSKIDELRDQKYDQVVAVVRGGLTAAHYIAKKLRLPVGVFYPGSQNRKAKLILQNDEHKNLLFVEDLVALGRTFQNLCSFMKDKDILYTFMPILVDANYKTKFHFECLRTSEWIVFPYEEFDKMSAGDRGLFRDNTDSYARGMIND